MVSFVVPHMGLIYFETAQKTNDRPAVARIAPSAFFSLKPLFPSRPLPTSVKLCYLSEESRRRKSDAHHSTEFIASSQLWYGTFSLLTRSNVILPCIGP